MDIGMLSFCIVHSDFIGTPPLVSWWLILRFHYPLIGIEFLPPKLLAILFYIEVGRQNQFSWRYPPPPKTKNDEYFGLETPHSSTKWLVKEVPGFSLLANTSENGYAHGWCGRGYLSLFNCQNLRINFNYKLWKKFSIRCCISVFHSLFHYYVFIMYLSCLLDKK